MSRGSSSSLGLELLDVVAAAGDDDDKVWLLFDIELLVVLLMGNDDVDDDNDRALLLLLYVFICVAEFIRVTEPAPYANDKSVRVEWGNMRRQWVTASGQGIRDGMMMMMTTFLRFLIF